MSGTGPLPAPVGPLRRWIGHCLLRAALFLLREPPRQAWCRDCTPVVNAVWERIINDATKRYIQARDTKGDR